MRSSSSACWSSRAGQDLPKDVLDAIEDAALIVRLTRRRLEFFLRQGLVELLEHLALLFRQLLRRHDLDGDEQVATAAAGDDVGHAAPAEAEGRAALCPFGNLERLFTLEGRNGDVAAEGHRRIVHGDFAEQIVAVAMEERVVLHMDDNVEVAGRTASGARLAFAAQAQALAARDARGNLHRQLARLLHATRSTACVARGADDRSGAPALPAGACHRKEPLLIPKLTASVALRARLWFAAGRGARAVARFAGFVAWDLDGRFDALRGFIERDFEVIAQIGATLRSASPALAAEHLADAENVTEAAKDVFEAGEDSRIESAGCRATKSGVAEAIVHVTLVGVGEDRIGFRRFLEFLFRNLVARIAIGMVFQRELAVRAFDLLVCRGARDAQDLVIVALGRHALATFTIAGRSRRSPSM